MTERQLDLFSIDAESSNRVRPSFASPAPKPPVDRTSDSELIAAIPDAGMADALALVAEAKRRRLTAAAPALESLCRRFTGFGADRAVPEQVAALEALALIGGSEARRAVTRILGRRVVQGPALATAMIAALRLGANLPIELVDSLLRHGDPRVRAAACRCVRPAPAVVPLLLELMSDIDSDVRRAAACALGRLGRSEARPALVRLLREAPSAEVVDAVTALADEDCVVLLGRIARTVPDLEDVSIDALEAIDNPRATQVLVGLRESDHN